MKNHCLIYREFGLPQEVVQLEEQPLNLRQGEVLVKMLVAPINPSDLIPIHGAYSHRITLPQIAGYEGVGKVVQVTDPQDEQMIGQYVLPLRVAGTWQTYHVASKNDLVIVPPSIDRLTAAQMYINPVTAWLICTKELNLNKGDHILINAGNSSISRIFIQLSKILSFKVIAIVRHEKYKEELAELGADLVVLWNEETTLSQILSHTNGKGVRAAIDQVGGKSGEIMARAIHPYGKFIAIGLLSGQQVDWSFIQTLPIQAKVYHLRHWADSVSNEEWQKTFQQLFDMVEKEQLHLLTTAPVYPFSEYRQALVAAEKKKEKIFLNFDVESDR
ncbi:zinc-dependent alcohol dehydrogenase family protein [Enterococcus mundtii]|uniref:enoyl-[acyl-carrier-protein] reductase n=1 Tax=Enterococcus mundtii TaxID=53346 RepID=A0A2S7RX37_ENTMU|nr:zinc-dependent alcohol dehydrogenase family protein [Enterococcus mundtii]MDA9462216.1 putative oxidoreductase [Enterococcus mundtii 3F]PQF24554.1 hypothetical protein CUS89_04005 [Enterococcus mundtii]